MQGAPWVWHTADHRKKKLLSHRHLSQLLLSCPLLLPCLGILGGPSCKLYRVFIIYYISQREKAANTSNACTVIYTVISSPLQKSLRTYVTTFTFKERTSFSLQVILVGKAQFCKAGCVQHSFSFLKISTHYTKVLNYLKVLKKWGWGDLIDIQQPKHKHVTSFCTLNFFSSFYVAYSILH